jgi:hypothetical protein
LEEQFEQLRENPLHIEAVPGRKTDAKDCEWIADLLQHGLLKEVMYRWPYPGLHDLTRYPVEQRQSQCRVADRTQDLLEQANLKLVSVTSNALGVSGRQMLEAISRSALLSKPGYRPRALQRQLQSTRLSALSRVLLRRATASGCSW